MTKYFKATFSDGRVSKRSSLNRTYTHAYGHSFASSHELAIKAAQGSEVVPVEEITAKEYRAK